MFPSCVSQRPGINRETIMDPTRARARVLDGHLILYSVLCSVRCSPYGENFAGIAELQKERATYQRHESSLIRVAGRSLNARYTFLAGGGFFLLPRSTQHNLLNPPPPSSLSLSLSLCHRFPTDEFTGNHRDRRSPRLRPIDLAHSRI